MEIECLIWSFYIIDTLYSYFDIGKLNWQSVLLKALYK